MLVTTNAPAVQTRYHRKDEDRQGRKDWGLPGGHRWPLLRLASGPSGETRISAVVYLVVYPRSQMTPRLNW